jgi:site-specific recombinase XerC
MTGDPSAASAAAGPASPAAPEAGDPARRPPAAETVRLYATDWAGFAAWCQASGCVALPAAPATVAAFLAATAATLSGGALGRRAAAIAYQHRAAGLASPTADPAVTALVRAACRGATHRRPRPPHAAQLRRMAAACPGDFSGVRDRALLLLAAAGLGRAALVGLDAEHVRFTATTVDLAIHTAGPDPNSRRTLTIPHGATLATCPVQALRRWLDLADTRFGPVFRKIDRWGTIEHRRLGTDALRRIFVARRRPRRAPPAGTATA